LPVVTLRSITITTGVMMAAPAMVLARSGTTVPCLNASLMYFQFVVELTSV
jgi:hypothetical protein